MTETFLQHVLSKVQKVLSTHAYFIPWLGYVFIWKNTYTYLLNYFLLFKKKSNERKCEKELLLYINIVLSV